MHIPVLLQEVLTFLDPKPGDRIIDGTVDGGGHAEAILQKITSKGMLIGFDWDAALLHECEERFAGKKNVVLVNGNYADIAETLSERKLAKADGLLLDLGFSSEQLVKSGRGFSFNESAAGDPLLMTYDDARQPLKDILKRLSEKEIANIIFEFGGERYSRRIARAIVEREKRKPILFAGELADVVRGALPHGYERGRIDPATRTFQAFRIYTNDELGNLRRILENLEDVIKPGGRAAIISFHSLEDRIVKQEFQKMAKEKKAELLTKKPIVASAEEIRENPRSRSAKLRAIKMKEL